ncbi:run domain Beclin-1-interacting and cysteine-rich domain-containing protein-like isoform X2 [Scleropages formosus]|uniref:run domain Beclin-1-interacting and cysteine-rich domain-containing protein-like isoform X2 n=1 Tax=Scleropages formosus TaxID=113540 RepID=UPI0010FA71DB|nr:run domain Beclin-1-interacting and cysteine-rich domain-containing protein-like isoform X2 [Scleropages formosus]
MKLLTGGSPGASMTDTTEAEDSERRQEHQKLLSSLKSTVEGLLATNNPNVWLRYGGLQRLHKDVNNILSHGLKHDTVYCKQKDYWRFVWCVRYICPQLASHVEQFSHLEPVLINGQKSEGEAYKAERWLLHSLQLHCLSAQLQPLLKHRTHTQKFYSDDAFLLSEPHVLAMLQCLEAVEQNNPKLVAAVDAVRLCSLKESSVALLKSRGLKCLLPGAELGVSPSVRLAISQASLREDHAAPRTSDGSPGAPWTCDTSKRGSDSEGTLQISVTESPQPAEVEGEDKGSEDPDDGPEYLAIGNLGQHRRVNSISSSGTSESSSGSAWTPLAASPTRRSSYSEGQAGPGRGSKGHSRSLSLSDSGLSQNQGKESSPDMYRAEQYGSFSPRSSELSTPNSVCLESDCSQRSSVSDGMFRKPSEGQSLISYLSEQDFGSCADLEKENAHFRISESLIAAIELMKSNMHVLEEEYEEDSDYEIQQLKQKIHLRRQQIKKNRLQATAEKSDTFPSTDSGESVRSSEDSLRLSDFGSANEGDECADTGRRMTHSSKKSFLSSDSITHSFLQSNSAESVAMGLLRQFEGLQLPAASELDWLVPEDEAPQKLLPIPDSLPISPDDGEHADIYTLRIRVRGNLEWAPPRPQIVFNVHSPLKRKVGVAKQNYRCAGCGTRIDPGYIKRLRFCEYLGRYFCQCCHENARVVVPARVLRKWDFAKYPVSNFARDLLGKIAGDPLFNLKDINGGLYKKVKALETVRLLRVQLYHMKNMFKTCRLADGLLDQFDCVPAHLTEDLHLFSLNDFKAARSGELTAKLRELLRLGSTHVAGCVLCQGKGFVCEFCGIEKDVIFPFQLNKCRRCEGELLRLPGDLSGAHSAATSSRQVWKFSRPCRLARALSRERKEGEGGEETVQEEMIKRAIRNMKGGGSGEEEEGKSEHIKKLTRWPLVKYCSLDGGGEGNVKNEGGAGQGGRKRVRLVKMIKSGMLTKALSKEGNVNRCREDGEVRKGDEGQVESEDVAENGGEGKSWIIPRLSRRTKLIYYGGTGERKGVGAQPEGESAKNVSKGLEMLCERRKLPETYKFLGGFTLHGKGQDDEEVAVNMGFAKGVENKEQSGVRVKASQGGGSADSWSRKPLKAKTPFKRRRENESERKGTGGEENTD